jgi:hypothetical protein
MSREQWKFQSLMRHMLNIKLCIRESIEHYAVGEANISRYLAYREDSYDRLPAFA